jgi:hypothetical protein
VFDVELFSSYITGDEIYILFSKMPLKEFGILKDDVEDLYSLFLLEE